MARLTPEEYAKVVAHACAAGLGHLGLALLDAHERAEAAEKECVSLLDQLQHSAIAEAELTMERDDLRQRLAAAEAALRDLLPYRDHTFECEVNQTDFCTCGMGRAANQARAALTPPAKEESGGVLHFAHAKHISPAKEEG